MSVGVSQKIPREIRTAVGPALVRASLVLISDVGTSILVQVPSVKVPTGASRKTHIP